MIAQRIKPGVLLISKNEMQDSLESFTMLNVSKDDALELLFASENVERTADGFVIKYNDSDLVSKMYKAIACKHKESNPKFIDVSTKYTLKDDDIDGTSLLLRDPKKHIIKVCRRSTAKSNECNINRLFIPNKYRDRFFKDVLLCQRYKDTNKWEIDSRDIDIYTEWSNFMNDSYFGIISELREKGRLN